jgi:hypothetical protein
MEENYFSTFRYLGEIAAQVHDLRDLQFELDHARFDSYIKDNPNLDHLRQHAKSAIEAYANALEMYRNSEVDRLYDKLEDSDRVINWNRLFKKKN